MDLNERIARALGMKQCATFRPVRYHKPGSQCDGRICQFVTDYLPDYAHSLDACLPVLADLREKGWFWAIDQFWRGKYVATMGNWNNTSAHFEATADSLAAALAECIAQALEAE